MDSRFSHSQASLWLLTGSSQSRLSSPSWTVRQEQGWSSCVVPTGSMASLQLALGACSARGRGCLDRCFEWHSQAGNLAEGYADLGSLAEDPS